MRISETFQMTAVLFLQPHYSRFQQEMRPGLRPEILLGSHLTLKPRGRNQGGSFHPGPGSHPSSTANQSSTEGQRLEAREVW